MFANFIKALFDWEYAVKAIKAALLVGTILFIINHGGVLLDGQMDSTRWISGGLTYLVPYMVHIYGQLCA